jgi:hypothetical protein
MLEKVLLFKRVMLRLDGQRRYPEEGAIFFIRAKVVHRRMSRIAESILSITKLRFRFRKAIRLKDFVDCFLNGNAINRLNYHHIFCLWTAAAPLGRQRDGEAG